LLISACQRARLDLLLQHRGILTQRARGMPHVADIAHRAPTDPGEGSGRMAASAVMRGSRREDR
jgi:hypothetical protein